MAATVLGNVLLFFQKIGIYDVVLPFLLVFTITFAIFERTKVLGTEKIGKDIYPKKNLNAMAAFVIAFMVIASSKLVEAITQISSQMVVLLLVVVFFLLLIGTFFGKDEEVKLEGGWRTGFMIAMLIGIIFIFLAAIKNAADRSWLDLFFDWLGQFWSSSAVAAIILMILIVAFVIWITKDKGEKPEKKKGEVKQEV